MVKDNIVKLVTKLTDSDLKKARFVRIDKPVLNNSNTGKRPIDKEWQFPNLGGNFAFDSPQLIKHIENKGNFGFVTGFNEIIVVDSDNEELNNRIFKILEENKIKTYVVKTGKGFHVYFKCKGFGSGKSMRRNGVLYGEIRADGNQVVCPGSCHFSGKKYEVFNNYPIYEIEKTRFFDVFNDFLEIKEEKVFDFSHMSKNNKNNDIYDKLSFSDVISFSGLKDKRNGEFQGSHPFHGSTSRSNFCVNPSKGFWKCFRHDSGGDVWSLYAIKKGLISCSDAISGCLSGKWSNLFNLAKEEFNWTEKIKVSIKNKKRINKEEIEKIKEEENIKDLIKTKKDSFYQVRDDFFNVSAFYPTDYIAEDLRGKPRSKEDISFKYL